MESCDCVVLFLLLYHRRRCVWKFWGLKYHLTDRIFGIPSSKPPKLVKLESSKLVHTFILALPTSLNYSISVWRRGVGHMTSRIFGIPLNISPKLVKVDSSSSAHSFSQALPTILRYNISGSGHSLDNMTPGKFGLSWIISPKPVKLETSPLQLVPSHKLKYLSLIHI